MSSPMTPSSRTVEVVLSGKRVASREERLQAAMSVEVASTEAGRRVDNFLLAQCRTVPRSRVYQMLRRGEVRVNGGRVRACYRIQVGDRVRIPPLRVHGAGQLPRHAGHRLLTMHPLLYRDPSVWVADKPAGLPVHAGSGCRYGLIEMLRGLPEAGQGLQLVHRLDRPTSGCLLLARDMSALRNLHGQWRTSRVVKCYLALLAGHISSQAWRVELPLRRDRLRSGERMAEVDARGRPACTDFRTVRRFAKATLVKIRLETGRTHQIRAHARHIDHPVAGDPKYASGESNRFFSALGLRRMFLHAHSLRFQSPATGRMVHVKSPLPEALNAVLAKLPNH